MPQKSPPNGAELISDAPDRQRTTARRLGRLLARPMVRFPRRFGLLEISAIGSLEWMRRHLAIINALEGIRQDAGATSLRVLDFGGADGSLARALDFYGLANRYRIALVDVDAEYIRQAVIAPPVEDALAIRPNRPLPFNDAVFDVAVSSDVFEHIAPDERDFWAAELRRVSRLGQVHTMPADSPDGRWAASETDRAWELWRRERGLGSDRWTREHLENGVPLISAIEAMFAPCVVTGIANASVWLAAMKAQSQRSSLAARIAFLPYYVIRLRRFESRPPFKNCLVVARAAEKARLT
jgi:methyltransferase family protein